MRTPEEVLGLMLLACVASHVAAESARESVSGREAVGRVDEEVIVTARKRSENVQQVPISITAVSEQDVRDHTMSYLEDIREVAANVLIGENTGVKGSTRVYIRGIGEAALIYTSDPAVGIYQDGVPLSRPVGTNLSLLDTERIEVLRGPQGTLYGKNTLGGAINYITKRPSGELDGVMQMRAGNEGRLDTRASFEGALGETLNGRLSIGTNKRDGFVHNKYDGDDWNDEDSRQARVVLDWQPADTVSALLSLDYYLADEHPNAPDALLVRRNELFPVLYENAVLFGIPLGLPGIVSLYGITFDQFVDGEPFEGRFSSGRPSAPGGHDFSVYQTYTNIDPNEARNDVWGGNLTIDWTLDDTLTVRSITGYRETDMETYQDSFGTFVTFSSTYLREYSEEYSQELQLLGTGLLNGVVDFVTGVFYQYQDTREQGDLLFMPELMSAFNLSTARDQSQETTSYAAFANATVHLTSELSATAGARWTQDEKDYDRFEPATFPQGTDIGFGPAGPLGVPAFLGLPGRVVDFGVSEKWDAWSGVASVQYQFTDDVMAYASWSRGFRSGGIAGFARTSLEITPYDPEYLDQWEVGVRSTWFDNRLLLNATAFLSEYTDQQLLTFIFDAPTARTGFTIQNVGESEITGFEVELRAFPLEDLELSIATGVTDAQYESVDTTLSGVPAGTDPSDLEFFNVPDWTANAAARYGFALPGVPGRFDIGGYLYHQSKVYFDIQNSENIAQGGYTLYDGRATWTSSDERLEVALWGKNLTDKRYRTWGVEVAGAGIVSAYWGDPRTYGLEVTWWWK
jgi:iron complex outermembrane receptor protein